MPPRKPKRTSDDECDPPTEIFGIGTVGQLTEYRKPRRVKKKQPIGFRPNDHKDGGSMK